MALGMVVLLVGPIVMFVSDMCCMVYRNYMDMDLSFKPIVRKCGRVTYALNNCCLYVYRYPCDS
jgi:hypothetical protein